MLKAIFFEMRPRQYTKNLLVYAAALFSGKLFTEAGFALSTMTFILFSFTASTVYIFNDVMDVEKDRQHPEKKQRPIAAGVLSERQAIFFASIIFSASLIMSFWLSLWLGIILLGYVLMNIWYSMSLKHVVVIDVMIIAFGFVLRAMAGSIAIGAGMTSWFILCVFMLSLFLALAKRRAELMLFVDAEQNQRRVLRDYSIGMIDQLITIDLAVTITSYSLFALQTGQQGTVYGFSLMMVTVPIVIYGIFRYLYLIQIRGQGSKPEDVLLNDKHILITCLVYVLVVILIRDM